MNKMEEFREIIEQQMSVAIRRASDNCTKNHKGIVEDCPFCCFDREVLKAVKDNA